MNKRASGNAFQDWICKHLEKQGYVCHNQKSMAKWLPFKQMWVSTRNDILGCIDVVAVNDHQIKMIQATLHTGTGKKLSELRSIPWPYDKVDVELWQKKSPRRIVVWKLFKDGECVDGEIVNGKWTEKEGV